MGPTQEPVAIVTGGGTGIGRAVSLKLAEEGCAVVVVYARSESEALDTVAQVRAQGRPGLAIRADVALAEDVQRMVAQVVQTFGHIRYLVNNAGITRQLHFDDLASVSDEIWDELMAVNVKGTFNCCRAAEPFLRATPGSAIVNIGSIAGETGYGSSLPYAVSKAAVHGLTRSLARVLAPQVRVNCIAPGAVNTRWWAGHEQKMLALSGHLPLQRISTPQDIAQSVWLLLNALSVTGQVLRAENGQTL